MKIKNLPPIDAGYWMAIVAASMCGANSGDLAAGPLGLGHVNGLLPMALIFVAIVVVEKVSDWTTVAFYWGAIIVLRTMATNLADLMGHDLKMSYPAMQVGLIALIVVMLLVDKARGVQVTEAMDGGGVLRALPATDWSYWITMLAAGTLGTVIGDWLAERDNLALGPYMASLACVPVFLVALLLAVTIGRMTKPWYWIVIVACRTLGTDLGDASVAFLRGFTPTRSMGLWVSTILTGCLLVATVCFWRYRAVERLGTKQLAE